MLADDHEAEASSISGDCLEDLGNPQLNLLNFMKETRTAGVTGIKTELPEGSHLAHGAGRQQRPPPTVPSSSNNPDQNHDRDRDLREEEEELRQLEQRRQQRKNALEKLSQDIRDKLFPRVEIFEQVEVFRAGTFKFERNVNYIEDIEKLKNDIGETYDKRNARERPKYNGNHYESMK